MLHETNFHLVTILSIWLLWSPRDRSTPDSAACLYSTSPFTLGFVGERRLLRYCAGQLRGSGELMLD